jgi:hypothetical protein
MSTRCQIGFYKSQPIKNNLDKPEVLLYRHCDGYPGTADGKKYGVLAEIVPFLKHFHNTRGMNDIEYCSAWLIHHMIQSHIYGNKHIKIENRDCLVYGICPKDCFHGDIEYYYAIYPGAIDVYGTRYSSGPKTYKKIHTVTINSVCPIL